MATVLGVHGVLYEYLGEESTAKDWGPALRDGLRRAKYADPEHVDVKLMFYGDAFRKPGTKKGGFQNLDASDLDETEVELLFALADSLAGDQTTKAAALRTVQWALRKLLGRKFFGALAGAHGERALLFSLRQVRWYLHDGEIRRKIHERFDTAAMHSEVRVVVGHSLGSVVAYERLCTGQFPHVRAFVSLGSPLGMPRIVFDCLQPAPVDKRGCFPPVDHWTNVADSGDLAALVKALRPLFGDGSQIIDELVHNGWQSHSVLRYLTAVETGRGIARGLG